MLTDDKLRSQVDALWDKLWTGGLSNPMDAIEQLSYLLFLKRMDEAEDNRERQAKRRGQPYTPGLKPELRWGYWTQMKAEGAPKHIKEVGFPALKEMGGKASSFPLYMQNAGVKIKQPNHP